MVIQNCVYQLLSAISSFHNEKNNELSNEHFKVFPVKTVKLYNESNKQIHVAKGTFLW